MNDKKSLLDLLRSDDESDDSNTIDCGTCGAEVSASLTYCPMCGGRTVLPTLGQLGQQLPIGIADDGSKTLLKTFEVVTPTFATEREIGRTLAARRGNVTMGDHVVVILSHCLKSVGNFDLTTMKIERRQTIIENMFMGDVFYIYAWIRIASLGKEITLKGLRCPECNHQFSFNGDLTTIENIVFDDFSKIEKKITLRDGFEIAGKVCHSLTVRPPTWSVTTNMSNTTLAELFELTMASSVIEVEGLGKGVALTSQQFDKFTLYDRATCTETMDYLTGGPRWALTGKCPKCQEPFFYGIDWTYDSFFALSSRSGSRKRSSKTR